MSTNTSTPDGMVSLSIGHGFIVHGSSEAIRHAQNVLLIDSTHPVERADATRYWKQLADEKEEKANMLGIALVRTRSLLRDVLARLDNLGNL